MRNRIGRSGSHGRTVGSFAEEQAHKKIALDNIFDELSESERENEKDKAEIS